MQRYGRPSERVAIHDIAHSTTEDSVRAIVSVYGNVEVVAMRKGKN